MQGKSKQAERRFDVRAQQLVVLHVAGALYGRSRQQIQGPLSDLGAWRVNKAIKSLEAVGVVVVNGNTIRQSRALARIDQLGRMGI